MAVTRPIYCATPGCLRKRSRRYPRCWSCRIGPRKVCACGRLTDGRKMCDVCRGKTSGKGRGKGGGPKPAGHWERFGL